MWCRVAWEEVSSAKFARPECLGGRGRLKAIFAGELLQGVALASHTAAATSASGKSSDAVSTVASEVVDGMGNLGSDAHSVVEMRGKAAASASAPPPSRRLWFLVRGAYVAHTHVIGEP